MARKQNTVRYCYCGNIEFHIVWKLNDAYDATLSNWGSWIHEGQKRPSNEFYIKVPDIRLSKADATPETISMVAYRAMFIAMSESPKRRRDILKSAELDDKGNPIIETRS